MAVNAHEVCPYLKPGTIVVCGRSVIIVVDDGAGRTEFVNIHNGSKAEYHEWWSMKEDIEIFEDMFDFLQAHFDEKPKIVLDKEESLG